MDLAKKVNMLQEQLKRVKPIVQSNPSWVEHYNTALTFGRSAEDSLEAAIAMLQAIHSETGEDEAE